MQIVRIQEAEGYHPDRFIAQPLIEGGQSNVRIIRLAPGQALPPHRHGQSDLMLYVVEGEGELDTPTGVVSVGTGALAFYHGDEELRVRNSGAAGMTLLAFLAPKFAAS